MINGYSVEERPVTDSGKATFQSSHLYSGGCPFEYLAIFDKSNSDTLLLRLIFEVFKQSQMPKSRSKQKQKK